MTPDTSGNNHVPAIRSCRATVLHAAKPLELNQRQPRTLAPCVVSTSARNCSDLLKWDALHICSPCKQRPGPRKYPADNSMVADLRNRLFRSLRCHTERHGPDTLQTTLEANRFPPQETLYRQKIDPSSYVSLSKALTTTTGTHTVPKQYAATKQSP